MKSKDRKGVKENRINEEIDSKEVRLISDGQEPIVVSTSVALEMAENAGLDLVEISSGKDMPIVKVIDYSKFRFEQLKRAKESKKKQKVVHVKEVKLSPSINENDYNHKVKNARAFLLKGDKVKFSIMFRGREIVHSEIGIEKMKNVLNDLQDCSVIEKAASMEGKNLVMILSPAAHGKTVKPQTNTVMETDNKTENSQ